MVVLPGCHLAGASEGPVLLRSGQDSLPKESPLWALVAALSSGGCQLGLPQLGTTEVTGNGCLRTMCAHAQAQC